MEKYDGSFDPFNHLRICVDLMRLRATSNAIMCSAFPSTLRSEARNCVANFRPKSIWNDSNLVQKNYAQASGSNSIDKNERFSQNITLRGENLKALPCPHDDALVIVANIVDFDVKKVLVDNGNAANIISWIVFLGLKISLSKIKNVTPPLYEFVGATIIPEGAIELPVTLGTYPTSVVIMTNFLLVKAPMAYNVIYGCPLLNAARAVVFVYYQLMKFSTSRGVGCVRGDQQASRRCYVDSILLKNTVMMLDFEQPK
ncbi:Uncharacterized protein Adt_47359 [Abeliophyllum distichum]|uniref:Uncharacterized protein n=1 Tax=Abeliophyllum distichum TaxID=126358 RepID=A0ABD1NV31_9LAMI